MGVLVVCGDLEGLELVGQLAELAFEGLELPVLVLGQGGSVGGSVGHVLLQLLLFLVELVFPLL